MDDREKFKEVSKYIEMQEQNRYKKDILDFYTSIIAKSYDKASTYSNLIIVAGFVLFFTFWTNVRNEVDLFCAKVSVILVIISVIFFIIWEIGKMISTSLSFRKLYRAQEVPPDKFREHMDKIKKEEEKVEANLARLWFLDLILTIIPGFAGAIILIIAYIKTLFCVIPRT